LMATLSLSSADFASPWLWWKFLTYGFAHMPYPMLEHVFWNMLGLWMFGRDIELLYGRRELLVFYLVTLVFGSLVWALRHQLSGSHDQPAMLLGASGAVTAVVLLFVLHYPKRTILLMFVLPVPAWVMGVLILGGDLMQMLASSGNRAVAFDVHLAGAAFAIAYYRFGWNLSGWVRDWPGIGGALLGSWKAKPRLKVHQPDEDDAEEDEQADQLLIKVRDQGISSLTSKERRILEAYSRRMRQKHQSS
jgi:membrane associated rhomboid family serine protease